MKEKSRFFIYPLIIMGLVLMLTNNCKKKDEVPALTTSDVTAITQTTATSGGVITSDGGAAVIAKGVCFGTGATPTIADGLTVDGLGADSYTSPITGLTAGTTYNVRAYATNSAGTGYGNVKSFVTLSLEVPVLTTSAVTDIGETTATCGGNITYDGGSEVTARGVCWGTGATPTIADSKTTDGTGTGNFTSAITGLTMGTTYYVRAYATNSAGTGYGTAVSFLPSGLPSLTTSAVTAITPTSATCGGNITSGGGLPITARGVCWGTGATPTIAESHTTDGTGTGSFVSAITGLTDGTIYFVRAYATNSAGTVYGDAVSFTAHCILNLDSFVGTWDVVETDELGNGGSGTGMASMVRGEGDTIIILPNEGNFPALLGHYFPIWDERFDTDSIPYATAGTIKMVIDIENKTVSIPFAANYLGVTINTSGNHWPYRAEGNGTITGCPDAMEITFPTLVLNYDGIPGGDTYFTLKAVLTKQ